MRSLSAIPWSRHGQRPPNSRCRGPGLARVKSSPTEVEFDLSQIRAHARAQGNLGRWFARQVDAGEGGASVECAKRRFEAGTHGRFAVGERGAAVDVVGRETGADTNFDSAPIIALLR